MSANPDGILAQTLKAAMGFWDAMKADGASFQARCEALERTLRASWPFTREWKYLCQTCGDYGLEMLECPGDTTCGRLKPHLPHDFGRPCWCSAGARFRGKPKPAPEDFAAAGKTKSKPFTRIGR